jgi:phosphotransferase system  glucose/maltose/N-acetylglucosamine-specific IIC component
VAGAGIAYLRPISLAGNNLTLIAVLVAAGLTLGTLSGMTTSVWRQGDSVLARAGVLAAFLWVLGMGARFAFALWVTHSGAEAVGRFSFSHDITGWHIWQFALVLMAYSEVLSRTGVLQFRWIRAEHAPGSWAAGRGGTDNPRPVARQSA